MWKLSSGPSPLFFVVGITCFLLPLSSDAHHYHHGRARREVGSTEPPITSVGEAEDPLNEAKDAGVGPTTEEPDYTSSEERTPEQIAARDKLENYHEKLAEQAGGHWAKFKVQAKQEFNRFTDKWKGNFASTVDRLEKGAKIVQNNTIEAESPEECGLGCEIIKGLEELDEEEPPFKYEEE